VLFAYAQRRDECRFQPRPRLLAPPSPGPFDPGSFSRAFAPLRSDFALLPGLLATPCGALRRPVLPGFFPSSRRHRRCLPVARACPLSLRSALRFLQPLDGFLHLLLRGLVSSRCHVQGFLRSGVCSRLAGAAARRRDLAPMPFRLARSPRRIQSLLTGLVVAATGVPYDFEALLRDAVRFASRLFKPARVRAPLRFLLPQALTSPPSTRFPGPSARDVDRLRLLPCGSSPSARLQRLVGCVVRGSVSGLAGLYKVSGLPSLGPSAWVRRLSPSGFRP